MSKTPELTELLAHSGWVHALARRLVGDPELADDLVQDAWLAALQRPPGLDRPVRGWLATVLRRRAGAVAHERAARGERERRAAREEALPSSLDVVAKAALQRDLVQAVLDLDEPYRSTILLRFFEDLPQREIARRMEASVATVNSRLARGLARLRERLDRAHGGDRRAWLLALSPFVRQAPALPSIAIGATMINLTTKVLAAAATVTVAFFLWRAIDGGAPIDPTPTPEVALRESSLQPAPRPESDQAAIPAEPERVALRAETPEPHAQLPAPEVPATAARLRGRVVDANGQGLAGVALRLGKGGVAAVNADSAPADSANAVRCTSAASGWFLIDVDASSEAIVSDDPRFATVLAGQASVQATTTPTVVVAPRLELAGAVVDESGRPLESARLDVRLPFGFGADFGMPLDWSLPRRWSAHSDASGSFALAGVPSLDRATLHVELGGYESLVLPLPAFSDRALEFVLRRPRAAEGIVRGVVVDPAGAVVRGARVSAGPEAALTDEAGRFVLDVSRELTAPRITAVRRGFLPAVHEIEPTSDGDGARFPEFVILRLGGAPGSIIGRVVDADARPVSGAKVWIDDPTLFSHVPDHEVHVETLAGREDEPFWAFVRTGDDGAFRIDGLLDRSYRCKALDPQTLACAEATLVPNQAAVEIALPTDRLHERIEGQVESLKGEPLPGVSVKLFRITIESRWGEGGRNETEERGPVVTDARGRFAFERVPKDEVWLFAYGDDILPGGTGVAGAPDPLELRIEVSRRLHVQIEIAAPIDRVDEIRFVDADAKRALIRVMHGVSAHASFEAPLVDGRSQVLALGEEAETLVLFKGGAEVTRVPLSLVPGELNVVRY